VKKLLLPLSVIALLGGLWFALASPERAPQISFSTLDGRQITSADLKGRVALINFWATSCPGCVAEMPKLVDTYQRYHAQGFEVVSVAMSYDPPDHVLHFAKKNALPFPVALDADGSLAMAFGDVQVTPTAIVIDQNGNIVRRVMGELDFAALHALLDQKLRRPGV
jgi:peroxiredoxin